MPSPVGHALGAVVAGWVVARPAATRRALAWQVGILAALGTAPDLDLLIGRHSRETHSIGAAIIAATVAAAWRWPIADTRARIFLAALCAWFSHPIMDALSPDTSVPIGVMIMWPFSREHWLTGWAPFWPIWRDIHSSKFFSHNSVALVRELAIMLPLVTLVWWLRRPSPKK